MGNGKVTAELLARLGDRVSLGRQPWSEGECLLQQDLRSLNQGCEN